ncbi:MAG: inositol-3-phosphate synthase [Firmicutes bacterium]|nr:inositol-3-phosphate synthase [Bacillota bacterium]
MSKEIKVAIVGVGNCASSFIQGLEYYRQVDPEGTVGLMHPVIGGYKVSDIVPVAAFDIARNKVGKDLAEAIFSAPNCAYVYPDVKVRPTNVKVMMGPVLDGAPDHLREFYEVSDEKPCDVAKVLRDSGAEILLNFLPTGSAEAARFYADIAIKEVGLGYMNGMPELIVCSKEYQEAAVKKNVPLIGDDVKSQLGGTIIHRALIKLFQDRGIKIKKSYQLNYAGNTDFANLVKRGKSKELTKTEALTSLIPYEAEISAGFAYVPLMKDRKTTKFYFIASNFGDAPLRFEATLEVEDSPNFGGTIADAIRCLKLALDRGIGGVLTSASAYLTKHPPMQVVDVEALEMLNEFIEGKRER